MTRAQFYDFDAFGSVIDAKPFIDQIAHANALPREIKTGPDPQILYFTGGIGSNTQAELEKVLRAASQHSQISDQR
jgi:hypothetical protein